MSSSRASVIIISLKYLVWANLISNFFVDIKYAINNDLQSRSLGLLLTPAAILAILFTLSWITSSRPFSSWQFLSVSYRPLSIFGLHKISILVSLLIRCSRAPIYDLKALLLKNPVPLLYKIHSFKQGSIKSLS